MTTPTLVIDFYERIWNRGDATAIPKILSPDFAFRGSLGAEVTGHAAFWDYVVGVRQALSGYRCDILECLTEGSQAFAKMNFSGVHVAGLRGYPPTGLAVHWHGAALFQLEGDLIKRLWVLGDLAGLDELLRGNAIKHAKGCMIAAPVRVPAGKP